MGPTANPDLESIRRKICITVQSSISLWSSKGLQSVTGRETPMLLTLCQDREFLECRIRVLSVPLTVQNLPPKIG